LLPVAGESQLADRRDDLQVGSAPHSFKAELVVALPGGTMSDGATIVLDGNIENGFRDDWPGQCRPERIALVGRVCADSVETAVGERLACVDNVVFKIEGRSGCFGLLELVFGLADIGGDADHLVVAILLFEQRDADGRVESAREGKRDAVGIR
jgi:hypothetical protein